MNTQVRTKSDDTRGRIIATAETLFRRLGFAKTAVADIAADLDMSPANIYRFFPSKNAIVQAICARCLAELDGKVWAVARSNASAADRIERLVLEILAYHKENLLSEKRLHDMVLVAMEHSWDAIMAHKETVRSVVERIVREGVEAGEFAAIDPRETSRFIMFSVMRYCHPVLMAQCLQDGHDLETEARAHVKFLLRAIEPRN